MSWTFYNKTEYNNLKYKFKNSNSIGRNYSQAFQDMFVLSILDGKKNGTYVEIGSYDPVDISNTYLLESEFDWKGISFEINPQWANTFNLNRKNKCICTDATTADYSYFFNLAKLPKQIDYLQIDIEPPTQSLSALKKIPLNDYRFSVITFETDVYTGDEKSGYEANEILLEHGYELLIKNVAIDGYPFENWYIDPNVIDPSISKIFKEDSDTIKESKNCVLND